MTMQSTTKRLTTATYALSLGLLLSGSLAMAADAPVETQSTAPAAIATAPNWTAAQRQQYREQYWDQMKKSAGDLWTKWGFTPEERQKYRERMQQSVGGLWTKWGLTPENRQQYWAQMQRGWHDLGMKMNPPAETPPTAPAMVAVAPAATPLTAGPPAVPNPPGMINSWTPEQRRQYLEQLRQKAPSIWMTWRLTPEERQQYWEFMQRG